MKTRRCHQTALGFNSVWAPTDALNARDGKWRGTADGKQRANTKRTVFQDYQTADKHLLKTSANEDDRGDATREQLSSRKLEKNWEVTVKHLHLAIHLLFFFFLFKTTAFTVQRRSSHLYQQHLIFTPRLPFSAMHMTYNSAVWSISLI